LFCEEDVKEAPILRENGRERNIKTQMECRGVDHAKGPKWNREIKLSLQRYSPLHKIQTIIEEETISKVHKKRDSQLQVVCSKV
jgi:hypothetical protein